MNRFVDAHVGSACVSSFVVLAVAEVTVRVQTTTPFPLADITERMNAFGPDIDGPDTIVETHAMEFIYVVMYARYAISARLDIEAAVEAVFTPFVPLLSAEDYDSTSDGQYFGGLGTFLSCVPEVVREMEFQKADIVTLKSGALEDVGPTLKARAQANELQDPAKFC